MPVDAVTLFFALLALLCQAWVVVAGAALLTRGRLRESLRSVLGSDALTVAFLVALVATLGSLYLSEVAHFPPCTLCWVQRAVMYPLVPVLGWAAWTRSWSVAPYAAGWAALGVPVSTWHALIERFPSWSTGVCDPDNPCTIVWVEHLGYVTIPVMAGSGFLAILTLLLVARPRRPDDTSTLR